MTPSLHSHLVRMMTTKTTTTLTKTPTAPQTIKKHLPRAPSANAHVHTLHSSFDYETGSKKFPIDVTNRARGIIRACILAIACIASPHPFQIFTKFYMVFLKDQFICLVRKTGEDKSLILAKAAYWSSHLIPWHLGQWESPKQPRRQLSIPSHLQVITKRNHGLH